MTAVAIREAEMAAIAIREGKMATVAIREGKMATVAIRVGHMAALAIGEGHFLPPESSPLILLFLKHIQYLSYDVTSGSDITPYNKIDKPRVVYTFLKLRNKVHCKVV